MSAIQTTPVLVREILDTVPILGAVADRTVRAGQQPLGKLYAAAHLAATYANAPLRYTLTPALPARLTFEVATRRLRGTGRIFDMPRVRGMRIHPVDSRSP